MSLAFIVMGDKTTHGGTVISADFTCDIHGKAMARVGDLVSCPQCKGVFPITSGAPDVVDGQGRSYARHMDSTACGARLLSSQITTVWANEAAMEGSSEAETEVLETASKIASPTKSGICLDCLRNAAHFGSPTVIRE